MSPSATSALPARGSRLALHVVLLLLTLLTTSATGARLDENFRLNRPFLLEDLLAAIVSVAEPWTLVNGLPFSLALLTILMAHEMGHYLTCRHYGIDASLPYFIPAPTLIGTLGAFIRIRSPMIWRRQLFDVGVAGPVAGFVFLLPLLAIGLAYSKVVPGFERDSDFVFGVPLLQRMLGAAIFPGVDPGDIHLHPVARAAWFGSLATALNLMPIGQLDGGHILYAFARGYHRALTNLFILALLPLAFFFTWSWAFWALLLFLLGRKHPRIYDSTPMGAGRIQLGIVALVLFVLCFSPSPVSPAEP